MVLDVDFVHEIMKTVLPFCLFAFLLTDLVYLGVVVFRRFLNL